MRPPAGSRVSPRGASVTSGLGSRGDLAGEAGGGGGVVLLVQDLRL